MNRGRIRYFICREYDHFAKDCTNITVAEKVSSDQMQQLMDAKKQESALKLFAGQTYNSLTKAGSE